MHPIPSRAVALLVALALPAAARAQEVSVHGSGSGVSCRQSALSGAVAVSCQGSHAGLTSRGFASAIKGRLRASAEATGYVDNYGGGSIGAGMTARANWSDVLRWAPVGGPAPRPRFVELDFWFHGDMAFNAVGQAASAVGNGSYQVGINNYGNAMNYLWNYGAYGSTGPVAGHAFAESKTVRIALGTDSYLSFFMALQVNGAVGGWGPPGDLTMTSNSDFMNTAGLTGVRFYDESGAESTGQVAYSFDKGTELLAAPVTTPEPATLALVVGGGALLGLARAAGKRGERVRV